VSNILETINDIRDMSNNNLYGTLPGSFTDLKLRALFMNGTLITFPDCFPSSFKSLKHCAVPSKSFSCKCNLFEITCLRNEDCYAFPNWIFAIVGVVAVAMLTFVSYKITVYLKKKEKLDKLKHLPSDILVHYKDAINHPKKWKSLNSLLYKQLNAKDQAFPQKCVLYTIIRLFNYNSAGNVR